MILTSFRSQLFYSKKKTTKKIFFCKFVIFAYKHAYNSYSHIRHTVHLSTLAHKSRRNAKKLWIVTWSLLGRYSKLRSHYLVTTQVFISLTLLGYYSSNHLSRLLGYCSSNHLVTRAQHCQIPFELALKVFVTCIP